MKHLARTYLLAGLSIALAACAPTEGGDEGAEGIDVLDDSLRTCASGGTLEGIDVSEHNGTIDWAKVKRSGRVFAVARVSDGLQHLDTQFDRNWKGIRDAGLIRGAYQYLRPGQDAVAQADLLIQHMGTLGPGDLPPVVDVENMNGQSGSVVSAAVRAWVERVKAKTGLDPIVYTASGFWNELPNTAQFSARTLWVANYKAQCPSMPTPWKSWAMWQYSETGTVSGVSGGIDLDVFNGSLAELQALARMKPGGGGEGGSTCATDADCNHGSAGVGLICATSGPQSGQCIDGCHSDADCSSGVTCDKTAAPNGRCADALPAVGTPCDADEDCSGDKQGTGRVCSASGHICIVGCHDTAADCAAGASCDKASSPWVCRSDAKIPSTTSTCPVLTFPSGIKIQTVANAATTASYKNHLKTSETAPTCFLDVSALKNPQTGETYTINVQVAAHFQLSELVGTEVDQGYGNFVLVNPAAVAALEKFRQSAGKPVIINSGFRSPKHQENVCDDLCGNPLGCSGTCANSSRHLWGDAFDLPTTFYTQTYSNMACASGFKFVYLESGTHLHVDQNPAYAKCVQQ